MDKLTIAGVEFSSRLFLGTGKFSSVKQMTSAIKMSKTELVTLALKRVNTHDPADDMLENIKLTGVKLLPNTSGVRNAKEAVFAAELAREALHTNFIKLEIHPDPKYLMPDPVETLVATEILAKKGFVVLPYIHADPVLCKRLEDVGTAAVMPLGSPIGSGMGLSSLDFLNIIIEQSRVPVIVDAGIGVPSDASKAMEIGSDAVLVNTAIAISNKADLMAKSFDMAVKAGRIAFLNGVSTNNHLTARATSPLTTFLDI